MTASNTAAAASRTASQSVVNVLDQMRADRLIELADLNASLWTSIRLAAWRGDATLIRTHLRQVGAVNREVKAIVDELGKEGVQ